MAISRNQTLTRRELSRRALVGGASMGALGSVLAACGSDDEDGAADGPVSLRFWKFTAEGADETIQEAIDQWNDENPDIQVQFETFPFDDYTATALTTAFAGGTGPDLFWIAPGGFLTYVNDGIPEPVNDLVDTSEYLEAAVQAVSVDGEMLAIPFEVEPLALYYRTDFLDEAGVAPPQTWDELMGAAEELTGGGRTGITIETAPIAFQAFSWYPFLWSAGGEVVNDDSTASALRTAEAASAFDLYGQLVTRGFAPERTEEVTNNMGPLGRGETSMQVCGFWGIAQMQDDFGDAPFGIVPIPVPPGGTPVTAYGGWTQVVNSRSPNLEQAKEFARWLWVENTDFGEEWSCRIGSKFSPREPVNDQCADVFEGEPHNIFTDQILETARAQPRYPEPVTRAVYEGLQNAMFTGASGEDAASHAADEIDAFLETYDGAPLNPET
jgi:multiple sugar transport system substrate-binding protein